MHYEVPIIAVVDDDEAVRAAVRLLLISYGWQVQVFASAGEFLDASTRHPPDCLVLDLNMPGMSGAELLEALSARGTELPSVVISGESESTLAIRARASGAKAILAKPFRDEDFHSSVARALAA